MSRAPNSNSRPNSRPSSRGGSTGGDGYGAGAFNRDGRQYYLMENPASGNISTFQIMNPRPQQTPGRVPTPRAPTPTPRASTPQAIASQPQGIAATERGGRSADHFPGDTAPGARSGLPTAFNAPRQPQPAQGQQVRPRRSIGDRLKSKSSKSLRALFKKGGEK